MRQRPSFSTASLLSGLAVATGLAACNTGEQVLPVGGPHPEPGRGGADASGGGGNIVFNVDGGIARALSLEIEPAAFEATVPFGGPLQIPLRAFAKLDDGSRRALGPEVTWVATEPLVGQLKGPGLFEATGLRGGVVGFTATLGSLRATSTLTVKLLISATPEPFPAEAVVPLKTATTPEPGVTWAYPYPRTVFPRGLNAPRLMWTRATPAPANAVYLVQLTSRTVAVERYSTSAPSTIPEDVWETFTSSSSGKVHLTVTQYAGGAATVIGDLEWTIAPGSMRGAIYYWANNTGRVMRIRPGASAPEDFSAGKVQHDECTMTCHTVSADGSTLVSGGDGWDGFYDLIGNKTAWRGPSRQWGFAALSPDGQYAIRARGPDGVTGAAAGLFKTSDGTLVPDTGLTDILDFPAFSPDGRRIAYAQGGSLYAREFDRANVKVGPERKLLDVSAPPGGEFVWPSISPDGDWVVYTRGPHRTDQGRRADLFMASLTSPDKQIVLSAANGEGQPLPAPDDRDLHYNYEPTFAPVASGGYFWIVFTSRRTYGTALTGAPSSTKQLWVTAVDIPTPEQPYGERDPSHPPFWLPGQALGSLNMRGFWALEPCKQDGLGCSEGVECCGGVCTSNAKGDPVCGTRQGGECSKDGERCDERSDCCAAASQCLNHVCSEPPPPN